jgi:hypothetical protein
MCSCLFVILAAFTPRLALFLVWVFTDYVKIAFHGGFIWPFLGLIFLPFTTLIYTFAYQPGVGVTGWGWFFVVIGVLLDLCSYGGGGYSGRERMQS